MFTAQFLVSVVQRERVRLVRVDGEVDMLTAPRLAAVLPDDGSFDRLVLDLSDVSFMSSAGLGIIASLHRRLGAGLVLAALQRHVADVLELIGLRDAVRFADDVPSALELLA